jgi:hypothetical protein
LSALSKSREGEALHRPRLQRVDIALLQRKTRGGLERREKMALYELNVRVKATGRGSSRLVCARQDDGQDPLIPLSVPTLSPGRKGEMARTGAAG